MPHRSAAPEPPLLAVFDLPRPAGPSLDERLLRALEAHAGAEADSLEAYHRLAESSGDPVIALLMRLVWEDEERHHKLLERMAATVRDDLYWTTSANALPAAPAPPGTEATEAIAATRAYIREEEESVRHLRQLARQDVPVHEGLLALILQTMAMDSQKHALVLRFILRRLRSRAA